MDDNIGTLSASRTVWSLQDTKVPVAIVAWNSTLTPKYLVQEERHSCLIDRRQHLYLHQTRGTQYVTGGEITGYTIATNTDAANSIGIGQSVIADEDIYQTLAAVTDGNGTDPTNYYVMYRAGASTWLWAASDMPFSYTPNGYINWDNAGTLTQGTGGAGGSIRYYNTYLIFTNTAGALRHVIVPGQNAYTTTTAAYGESFAAFTLTGFPKEEWVAMYQFTWQTGAAGLTNKGKCRLTRAPQRITTSTITVSQTTPVPHNSLTGLQGGTANEYYHLTSAEYAALTGGSSAVTYTENFTATASQTNFALARAPLANGIILVARGGIVAQSSDWSISGSTLIFGTGLDDGTVVHITYFGTAPAGTTPIGQPFTASEGQTTFTLAHSVVSPLVVAVNGVVQAQTAWSITNGTSLVFTSGLVLNDTVWISYIY